MAVLLEQFLQIREQLFVVVEISARVIGSFAEPFDPFIIGRLSSEFLKVIDDLVAKFLRCHLLAADTDD